MAIKPLKKIIPYLKAIVFIILYNLSQVKCNSVKPFFSGLKHPCGLVAANNAARKGNATHPVSCSLFERTVCEIEQVATIINA